MATAREISASLAGESAPGADAYSYRGLYAGMARSRIEAKVAAAGVRPDTSACHVPPKPPGELACGYDVMLGPDHAHVHLDVTYAPAAANGIRQAREITVTRQLPLDVDGVRVSGALADAFAAQTTLLDTRDATYGHHQAHVRMGTLNGARAHYAEVTVVTHSGREELTVKLGRGPGK
jgi:hypothetical protein